MKVGNILEQKGDKVLAITKHQPLLEAVNILNENRVRALIVEDEGNVSGIISERDVMRYLTQAGGSLATGIVADIMTRRSDLVVATPDDTLEHVMWIMSSKRVRHLPIMTGSRLVGLVSIGDVVKNLLGEKTHQHKMMVDYIDGDYY